MIFASRVKKTIPVLNDPPHTVTIQKLPRRHFIIAERSEIDHQTELAAGLRQKFGDDWRAQLGAPGAATADNATKKAIDPLLRFDVEHLLKYGVKAWTYTDPPEPTPEALDDLDLETAEYLAREVLRLSAPKLFDTDEGETRKNDSASSGAA